MKKEIIENIYNQKYASLKEDISKIISQKAVSVLEHMKVHTAKKFFSLREDYNAPWDQSTPKPGEKAAPVATPGGQKWGSASDWAKDVKDQLGSGKAPSRDVDSQGQKPEEPKAQTPTAPSPTSPAGRVTREPLPASRPAAQGPSGDQPVRTVRTQGGDYPVYKKDSETAQSFRDAFGAARSSGKSEFEWQGRKYGTAVAGERPARPTAPATQPRPASTPQTPAPQSVPGAQDTSQPPGGSGVNPWRAADQQRSVTRRPVGERPGASNIPPATRQPNPSDVNLARGRGIPGVMPMRGPRGE